MTNRLPPFDSNGFYLTDGSRDPHGFYGPPRPPDADQVETALAYLSQLGRTKQPTFSSYYLKHRAEGWGRFFAETNYVSNGALIAAAVRLGLVIKPFGINAGIGVSKRDVDRLYRQECEARKRQKR
jgi:hypothetical protein